MPVFVPRSATLIRAIKVHCPLWRQCPNRVPVPDPSQKVKIETKSKKKAGTRKDEKNRRPPETKSDPEGPKNVPHTVQGQSVQCGPLLVQGPGCNIMRGREPLNLQKIYTSAGDSAHTAHLPQMTEQLHTWNHPMDRNQGESNTPDFRSGLYETAIIIVRSHKGKF